MNRRGQMVVLSFIVFFYWVGLYLYVPTLPTYVQGKTNSLAMVGTVLSMYGLWQAIIRFPVGIAADWLGWRKPFILAGLGLVGLGAWLLGISGQVSGLLIGRAITGIAAGTWVPLVVVFSGLFPPREAVRAAAVLNFMSFGGRMVATGVTGYLNELGGYSLAFNLSLGVAVIAILLTLTIKENRRPAERPSFAGTGALVTRSDVLLPSVLATISHYAVFATTFAFLPILARQLGATDVTQSILVSMNIGLGLLSSLLVTGIAGRVSSHALVYTSVVLSAVGIGVLAVASSLTTVFVAQVCLGLGFGISYPVLMGMSIERVSDNQRTTAMGLFQSIYSLGMFGGPWISGLLAEAIGVQPMLGVTAFVCLTLGLFLTRYMVQHHASLIPQKA